MVREVGKRSEPKSEAECGHALLLHLVEIDLLSTEVVEDLQVRGVKPIFQA